MQLFFRLGARSSSVVLSCQTSEDVQHVKEQLSSLRPAAGPADCMVLCYAGRIMEDDQPLAAYSLSHGCTVHVSSRLRGGGGDGGSTGAESRSCYLEMYQGKKPDKVNPAEELLARWTRCHLSGADLSPPCVIDELGNLYNKDAVLHALLTKALPPSLAYITGLKAVTELKFTRNENFKDQPKTAAKGLHQPGNESRFLCPITGLEFNGRFKFQVHRPSGQVVSEKAVKEVPAVVGELVGSSQINTEDFIPVNPSGEQLDKLKEKLAAKMALDREKKARKAAAKLAGKGKGETSTASGAAAAASNGEAPAVAGSQAAGRGSSPEAEDLKHSNGSSLVGQKRSSPTPAPAAAAQNHAGAVGQAPAAKKAKAAKYQDPVFASLFTSSLSADALKESYLCRNTSARGMHLS